eukprot:CAMPEP_0198217688 /NCGR_PEP_ID=MMETSP1445-20131203/65265_1 /TAXON_ID=36898 /ORGANISM="Pyramimonas sp., Strain CCMP2087" /LENGTH=91 /DNA_ID=CAMNT_0043894469 /DNA_START=98 /DNA_END=373 /DNA_ORIENTATION=+
MVALVLLHQVPGLKLVGADGAVDHGAQQQLVLVVHVHAGHALALEHKLGQLNALRVPQPDGLVVRRRDPARLELAPLHLSDVCCVAGEHHL